MADPRIDDVMSAILTGRPHQVDDERDYEAEWEARRDPEADLDRMEDRYETEMDRRWE